MGERIITQKELDNATRFKDFAPVYRVDAETVVKTSKYTRLAEAAAMRLASEKTTIPVPEVLNAYTDPATSHVRTVMEFVEGECLEDVWEKLNVGEQQSVIDQLGDFVAQMRRLKGSLIASVDGSACEDQIFEDEPGGYGPYETEDAFNKGIVKAIKNCSDSAWANTICDKVLALKSHDVVFSHGDLMPWNILVRGSTVVVVLDWENAGYYPEHWEYVKALFMPGWDDESINRVMKPYLAEQAIFRDVRRIVAW